MAMLFLALAIIPIMDSILWGSRRVQEDKMRVFATALAASTVERYRLELPGAAAGAVGGAAGDPVLNPASASAAWHELRARFSVVATYSGDDRSGILGVEVSWDENGQTRSIQLQSVLARTYGSGGGL
jgi:hypothetical protein